MDKRQSIALEQKNIVTMKPRTIGPSMDIASQLTELGKESIDTKPLSEIEKHTLEIAERWKKKYNAKWKAARKKRNKVAANNRKINRKK